MSKLKIKLRLNSLINMKWRIYFLIMRQKRNEKVQMANYSLACPTCYRVGAQLSFTCQNIASSLANRWWCKGTWVTWNLLHILTKGSQLDLISSDSFRFLGVFLSPPLFKSNLVYRDCISQLKISMCIYIYIFQNYFVLFKKGFSLIRGEAI